MKKGMGEIERRLFAWVQMRGKVILRAGELLDPLRLTPPQERNLLSRLAKAGWIVRVQRGLYLVPSKLPLGGQWSPGVTLALSTLVEERGGRYQICGPNAFNQYGFDEQIPIGVYAYNNRISGRRSVGALSLTLIKVDDDRLGSTENVVMQDGVAAVYSSRVRTLIDAVYDWARFASLPRGFVWIRQELAARRVSAEELVKTALCYGDRATVRRIGWLLDREGVSEHILRKLAKALPDSTGLIPWNPVAPKRGTINRRWGVVVNDDV